MVFVPVTEFLIQYSWGDSEVVEYAPRRRNHWQAKQIAEKLGFECPAYPLENEEGYAIFTKLVEKRNCRTNRQRVNEYNAQYQMATVENFDGTFQQITFSADGYKLESFDEKSSNIVEVENEIHADNSYSNGIGRFADHR